MVKIVKNNTQPVTTIPNDNQVTTHSSKKTQKKNSSTDKKVEQVSKNIPTDTSLVRTGKDLKELGGGITSVLTTKTADLFANKINALENKEEYITSLLTHLEKGILSQSITDENIDYYALEALLQGKITQLQYGTLLYFKAAVVEALENGIEFEQIQMINLIAKKGKAAKETVKYLKQTAGLTDAQSKKLIDTIKKASNIEQHFLLIPKSEAEKESDRLFEELEERDAPFEEYAQVSITALAGKINYNLFGQVQKGKNEYEISPSLRIVQEHLKAKYGKNALEVRPLIGIPSQKTTLKLMKEGVWPISLPTKEIPLPTKAHGFKTTPTKYIVHDIFHLNEASQTPDWIKKPFFDIATHLSTIQTPNKIEQSLFSHLTDLTVYPAGVDWDTVDLATAFTQVFRIAMQELILEESDELNQYIVPEHYKTAQAIKWTKYIEHSGIVDTLAHYLYSEKEYVYQRVRNAGS